MFGNLESGIVKMSCAFVFVIVVTIMLEVGLHKLEHDVQEHSNEIDINAKRPVLQKAYKELMMLGKLLSTPDFPARCLIGT